jgi:phospholipase C
VISPLISKNLIDHRLYDHASIPATLESLFGLTPLTNRDSAANRLTSLLTLTSPRQDAPTVLPPVNSAEATPVAAAGTDVAAAIATVSRPNDSADDGNLPGIVHAALRQDLEVSPSAQRPAIITPVRVIKTRSEAMQYLNEVRQKVAPVRAALER